MSYKPKKAGELRIKNLNVSYLKGLYRDRSFIVKMKDRNTIYLDRTQENGEISYAYLSGDISHISFKEDDSYDIYEILLQAKDGITMSWDNGTTFKGEVKPIQIEDGRIVFLPIEGRKMGMHTGPLSISVRRENGDIVFSQTYRLNDGLLSNESLFVKDDGSVSDEDLWKLDKILEFCYLAKWEYRNGNCFKGVIKYDIKQNADSVTYNVSKTATKGVFIYSNKDRFEGDVSSASVGPFFVDGTTYFSDGSMEKGNWLEKFNLSNDQWQEVYKCSNPSVARALAQKFMQRNSYPEYEYWGGVTYFDPSQERREICYSRNIVYDKSKRRYWCKSKDSEKILLVFAVDNKGYRKWEVVFKDGEATYINEYTWYSNGVIESIKSYTYDTREKYMSCYFFSDGKLRSAYQYSRGNNGKIVLRKSKESHPTYGGYTSKLYDLNGIYERTISWEIGEGFSLFGGSYNKEMAPEHLIFNELKQKEINREELQNVNRPDSDRHWFKP